MDSVDEIPWCDDSNETSSAVLSQFHFVFYKMKLEDTLGSERVNQLAQS